MNNNQHDIEDYQIRVIQRSASTPSAHDELSEVSEFKQPPHRRLGIRFKRLLIIGLFVILVSAAVVTFICLREQEPPHVPTASDTRQDAANGTEFHTVSESSAQSASTPRSSGYTTSADTIIQGRQLTLLTPHNATPCLLVGAEHLADAGADAALILQAADVRGDNQAINCAFVQKGQLLARGRRKAGYCAILDGKINIGTASYTPLLEECIERGGDFFRQYPLVAGSNRVNNTRRDKAMRRALAQIDGEIAVVITHERMSLNDFADLLVGLGAEEAIYLVGSTAYGSYRTKEGERVNFGKQHKWQNVNFIAWH